LTNEFDGTNRHEVRIVRRDQELSISDFGIAMLNFAADLDVFFLDTLTGI
jgi:hypothetical protein